MPIPLKRNKYRLKKLPRKYANGGSVGDPPAESKDWWNTLTDYYKGMKTVANSNPSLKAIFNELDPISKVSTSLASLGVPGNLVAEAVEGIGGKGDGEFNITDAIPGMKGDFSFTNINDTPTKTVSGVTGVEGIPGFALDVVTDPSSYVGVGIAKNVLGKTLPKVVKAINKPGGLAFQVSKKKHQLNKFLLESNHWINSTAPIKRLKTLDTGPLKIKGESFLDYPKLHKKKAYNEILEKADEFSKDFYGDPDIEKHFKDMYGGADAIPQFSKEIINDPTFKKRMATYKWINSDFKNVTQANMDKMKKLDKELASKYPREEVWSAQDSYIMWNDAHDAPGSTIEAVFKKGKKGELEKGFNIRTEEGLIDAGGHYNPMNNKAFVNENYGLYDPKWAEATGVHELNHASTVQFLRSPSGEGARLAISDMIKADLAGITKSGKHYGLVDGKVTPEYISSVAEVTARVQEGRLSFKKAINRMTQNNPKVDWSKIYTGDMSQLSASGIDPVALAEKFLKVDKGGIHLESVLKGANLKEKAVSLINLFRVSPLVAGAAGVTAVNALGGEENNGPKLLKGGKIRLLKK